MNAVYHLDSITVDDARDVLMLNGWAFVPGQQIRRLVAQIDADTAVACTYGLPRPDVATAYQLGGSFMKTGFGVELPLSGRRLTVTLRIAAACRDGAAVQMCTRPLVLGSQHTSESAIIDFTRLNQFPEELPVFVVGMSRSGTSAITLALLSGAGFPGFQEGHLFNVLGELLQSLVASWCHQIQQIFGAAGIATPGTAIAKFDIYSALNRVVVTFHEVYHDRFQSNVWVDKTTDSKGIRTVPLLHRIYPRARFIFMYRHPIKVALSRQRKFPELPLIQSFIQWKECVEQWKAVRGALDPESVVEISQTDLSVRTDSVVEALTQLLQLNPDQAAGVARVLKSERPENTGSSSDFGDVYLEDLAWEEFDKDAFRSLCLRAAEEMGFPATRSAE
jgi:hypothetical protein